MSQIVTLKEKTTDGMFELVMETCTKLQNGELDDLGATCIIMDAVHELIGKKKETASL